MLHNFGQAAGILDKINWADNQLFLLRSFSHILTGPINTIQLSSGLLETYLEDLGTHLDELNNEPERSAADFREAWIRIVERMPKIIQGINGSTHKLNQGIADLSEFIGRGTIATSRSVDLNKLIPLCASLVHHQAYAYTNRFSLDLEPDLPLLTGNAQQIVQTILNLLTNALRSLPDRSCGVVLAASCNHATGSVQICVQDEGIGISPDIFPHICDPFFTTWQEHGCTGLGLTVAERFTRNAGGTLSIDSKPGKGTAVRISLPFEHFVLENKHA